jgi:hypothetical protein
MARETSKIALHGDVLQVGCPSVWKRYISTNSDGWILWGVTNRLDSDTLGVNSAEVGVLEEGDEISLNGFLQSANLVSMLVVHSPERVKGGL